MNRHISKLGLIAAIGAMAAGTAFAGPMQMTVSSGGNSSTFFTTNGSSYTNSDLNGWDVSYFVPESNSPSTQPWGLDLGGFTTACMNSSGCGALTVSISATGFTTPVGANEFGTTLGGALTGSGSVMQTAYWGASNQLWDESGTIGTLTSLGSTVGGGPAPAMDMSAYSLTLVDTFNATCTKSNCASFSIDGDITGVSTVPEPGTLALFGAGLLGCGLFVSRRRRARQS
jgi:hypothetical protein